MPKTMIADLDTQIAAGWLGSDSDSTNIARSAMGTNPNHTSSHRKIIWQPKSDLRKVGIA
jgi:hypothetical protein